MSTRASSSDEGASGDGENLANRKKNQNEIVLQSFFYMLTGHIDNFKTLANRNLKVFIAIGQPVESLEGIEQLTNLAELWVCESHLSDAAPVNGCQELRKLHLYSNRLQAVPPLNALTKLTNLSLASNRITALPLCFPHSLRELNLADNAIEDLGGLTSCKQLEILNLAGTNIRTFSAIEPLTSFTKLRYIYFFDQMYNASPITSLVNYRSYTIFRMDQLKMLDGTLVETEERERAKTFYLKKFRFYRVLHNNHVNSSYAENSTLLNQSFTELNTLRSGLLNLNVSLSRTSESSTAAKECLKKLHKYETALFNWDVKHLNWAPALEHALAVKRTLLELEVTQYGNVSFFHHTRENGRVVNSVSDLIQGFICPYAKRMAKLSSVKIIQVVQILNAQHHDFNQFKGVKEVLGVGIMESELFIIGEPVGVNSSENWPFSFIYDYVSLACPNSMKCKVTNSIAIADARWMGEENLVGAKRVLVLGYVISPELMGSCTREETAKAHFKWNDEPTEHCHNCATYSSSIPENVVPAYIVEYCYTYKDEGASGGESTEQLLQDPDPASLRRSVVGDKFNTDTWHKLTTLNLSKTLLSKFGRLTPFETVLELDVSYNRLTSLQEIAAFFPKLERLNASFNEISSTNMGREMSSLKELALQHNKLTNFLQSFQWLKRFCKALERLEVIHNPFNDLHRIEHIEPLAVKLIPKLRKLNGDWLDEEQKQGHPFKLSEKDFRCVLIPNQDIGTIEARLLYNGAACYRTNCLPTTHLSINEYRELICIYIIDNKLIQEIEIVSSTSSLKWLTIRNNLLSNLEFIINYRQLEELDVSHNIVQTLPKCLNAIPHLVRLNLSNNYIRNIDVLSTARLSSLRVLNLSYNGIRSLQAVRNLSSLEELYAAGNELRRWDHLQFIKDWKQLKILDLSRNAVEDEESMRKFLIFHSFRLEYINGVAIGEDEISSANDSLSGTLNKNYLVKIYKPNQIKSMTELTVKKCGIRKTNFRDSDFHNLTSVNLEGNTLTTLGSLSCLTQLKHLSLANNEITSFGDATRAFDNLETLHLNFNNIADLVPLQFQKFPNLTALYLQDNRLTSVEGLKELRMLQYLILDRNKLTAISGDELSSESLKELYAEHNQIQDLWFVRHLKNLKKLFLAHNKVPDHTNLGHLGNLGKLNELTLVGNPVSRLHSHYQAVLSYLPKLLLLDGHTVELLSEIH